MTSEAVDERRLHPAATAIDGIRHARGAAAAMLVVIATQGLVRGALIVLALLVLGAAAAFVQWRTTRYAVVDGTLRLRTGVFSKNERNIPGSRISALDTSRGLLQRIFGVVAVQIQTPGGNREAEITLRAVTFAEAERLRHELGHRANAGVALAAPSGDHADSELRVATDPSKAPFAHGAPISFSSPSTIEDPAPVVYAIRPRELVVAALTSPSVAVAGATAAALVSVSQDALPDALQRQLANAVDDLTLTAVIVLAIGGLIAAAVISVVGSILLYGGFQVTRDDRRLRVRRGLITERVGTIPLDRIHGVRIIEAPLRQLLGYAAIEVEVAGYAGQDEVTRTLVPLIRRDEIPQLLHTIVPTIVWPGQPFERVPDRGRRRYLTVPLLLSLPLIAVILVAPIGAFRLIAILAPMCAVLIGRLAAREAGWLLDRGTVALRWRSFARITLLAQSERLQRMEATSSPWQRRANLGTFGVHLSNARRGRVRHLDAEVIHGLLARTGR